MATENGMHLLQFAIEFWPAACFIAGFFFGRNLTWHYAWRYISALARQVYNLEQLNGRLADDNERIINYSNYLRGYDHQSD